MTRRHREHRLRRVHSLDGVWDFAFLGEVNPDAVDVAAIHFDGLMPVPGCFDATPRWAGVRGVGAYRARLPVGGEQRVRLAIGAAQHWCRAFVGGTCVGEHSGGYTAFHHDFTAPTAPGADLVLLVDNRLDTEHAPLHRSYFDWYQYGGLTRGVDLHELPDAWIDRLEVRTSRLEPPTLAITIHCGATATARLPLLVRIDGRDVHAGETALAPPGGAVELGLELPGAALWSPASPCMHELAVRLGDDDRIARVGIRTVGVGERTLLLNGEPITLRGVNRHEVHPAFGHAVPVAIQLADLMRIKELGANMVRGSHYPQDPAFLDLCDELGVLVWNEAIGWQQTAAELSEPAFVAAMETHIDELVRMSAAHPSVVLWGLLNEADSASEATRPAFERLIARLRRLDPSRPVTFASNRHGADRCLDLIDVVSVNAYPGWYFGTLESIPDELRRILGLYRAAAPGKPIVVSEIGAGALYGCHDTGDQRWTEEYQAALLDSALGTALAAEADCAGVLVWQFTDCRTTDRLPNVMGRPRGYNNKGLFDEHRRPKLAFEAVRQRFREGR